MTTVLVLASSLSAVLLAVAWVRELRLRHALQRLIALIFAHWRKRSHVPDELEADAGPARTGDDRMSRP